MNLNIWIDSTAILMSSLSTIYSRWSYHQAKKATVQAKKATKEACIANKMSVLEHKKEIYNAFYELKIYMKQETEFAKRCFINKFYYASRKAPFYFNKNIADNIKEYYVQCFDIADLNEKKSNYEQHVYLKRKIKTASLLSNKIEKQIFEELCI